MNEQWTLLSRYAAWATVRVGLVPDIDFSWQLPVSGRLSSVGSHRVRGIPFYSLGHVEILGASRRVNHS